MAKAPKKKLTPDEVLEAARRAPDAEIAADLVLDNFDDPALLCRQLWDWTRQGALNTAATPLYWKPMAADPSAFSAQDLLDLLLRICDEPECAGLARRGRVLPAGWRKELDALLAAVRSQPAPLVDGLKKLREPMLGGLAYALAREKLIPVTEVPDRILREIAEKLAKGDASIHRDVLSQPLPWTREVVAEATAEAALTTEGRIDGLEDLLSLASAAAQRRLFEKRAFGALEVVVKAADKTLTWLEDHLAAQSARPTGGDYLDTLRRQAALAAWIRLRPLGTLPARFEPLAEFALTAPGSLTVAEVISAVAPASRERLLLGCAGKCDDLQWLDAARLVPTQAILAAAVEHACEAADAFAKPELEPDLEDFLESLRKRLVALGPAVAPLLSQAQTKHPPTSAAARLAAAAQKGLHEP